MLKSYVRIAYAVFKRRKFFTFVNLFGISFTLAILLVGTALLDYIFAGAPPEVHQRRTLGIFRVALLDDDDNHFSTGLAGYDLLDRTLRDLPGAEQVSISSIFWKALSYVDGQRVESFLRYTDAEFFEILQFDFLEGRPYTRDEAANGAFVAVINVASRERFFAGEPAVGRMIEVDGKRYRVVGVVANVPLLRLVPFADIWVPLATADSHRVSRRLVGFYQGLILARSPDHFPMIRDEFASRMAAVDLSGHQPFDRILVRPETAFESIARTVLSMGRSSEDQSARLLRWLIGLAVLFMVLPAINLVNLNVSRIMERAGEIGVRKAFGAPTLVLVGQFVTENVLLTLVGGGLAVIVTYLALGLISSAGWIPYAQFHLNLRMLGYALAASLVFGLLSGVYPAWRMSRMNPVDALRGVRS